MKTSTIFLFSVLLLFVSSCNNSGGTKENGDDTNSSENSDQTGYKYDLKSAIVTSKTNMAMAGGDMTTILYFDDHGEKYATENINKMSMMGQTMETHSKTIMKDGYIYTWNVGEKTGNKMKLDMMKNGENFDYKKMSKEMMDQMKIKKTGTDNVQGKKCDVYEMNDESMTGKYYIWDNITMKSETSISGMTVTTEVTDLKENASIPASTFEVPGDVAFTEMSMPAKQ